MAKQLSEIDKLYDENNNDNIILYDENNNTIEFEQIAVIPIEKKVYAILTPVTPMDGVDENTGLVFSVESNKNGEEWLSLINDEEIINSVFDIYESLIKEEDSVDGE